MKRLPTCIAALLIASLSGCVVAPAYGPGSYYEPQPYYPPAPYYGAPTVIVPGPFFHPHRGYRHGGYRHGGWHR